MNVGFVRPIEKRLTSSVPPLPLLPIWILAVPFSNYNTPALSLPPLEINTSTFVSLWPPPTTRINESL